MALETHVYLEECANSRYNTGQFLTITRVAISMQGLNEITLSGALSINDYLAPWLIKADGITKTDGTSVTPAALPAINPSTKTTTSPPQLKYPRYALFVNIIQCQHVIAGFNSGENDVLNIYGALQAVSELMVRFTRLYSQFYSLNLLELENLMSDAGKNYTTITQQPSSVNAKTFSSKQYLRGLAAQINAYSAILKEHVGSAQTRNQLGDALARCVDQLTAIMKNYLLPDYQQTVAAPPPSTLDGTNGTNGSGREKKNHRARGVGRAPLKLI